MIHQYAEGGSLIPRMTKLIIAISALTFAITTLLALPLAITHAQDADDSFENADPCKGDPANPVVFQLYPGSGPAGSTFLISGKPHDSRTVGPGSSVIFNWQEDTAGTNYSAYVGADGRFVGVVKVPSNFLPGKHVLAYAEASPFTSCYEFEVTAGQATAPLASIRDTVTQVMALLVKFISAV